MFRFFVWLVVGSGALGWAQDFQTLKSEAEALFARGDFAAAHALYERIPTNGLPVADLRWVEFRRDDTGWRIRDAENLPQIEQAAPELARLGTPEAPPELRDRVWAEAQESIGDFHWRRRDAGDWIQKRYNQALGWWAGQTNLPLARTRYLGIVEKLGLPEGWPGQRPRYWSVYLQDDLLDKALTIAERPADVAPLRLLRAQRLGQRRDPASLVRAEQDFEKALAASAGIPGRDLVLWQYAQWRERSGRLTPVEGGRWQVGPDAAGAVKLYRQLRDEFGPGRSQWRDAAGARIEELTAPAVSVAVPGTFLPGSEVELYVSGRNVRSLTLTIRSIDLSRDLEFPISRDRGADWKAGLAATGPVVEEMSVPLDPAGPHEWTQKEVTLPKPPTAGAYLVEVTGAGRSARDLLLVTDAAVVVQAGPKTAAWVVESNSGRPISEAPVRVAILRDNQWRWSGPAQATDGSGLASFDVGAREQVLVVAGVGARQSYCLSYSWWQSNDDSRPWRIYAFTDRPAYRPGDAVEWKFTARRRSGGTYTTPVGAKLGYELHGPQGAVVTNGVVTFNSFGSAWGSFVLDSTAELGMYLVRFFETARPNESVGDAELFRLEEYRLPEFEVSITPPEEREPDGTIRPKRLRAGEPITVKVSATYYFGGPVPGAQAEITVRSSGFHWFWSIPTPYPWLYAKEAPTGLRRGAGDPLRRETVLLDAQGQGTFTFDPGPDAQDSEYMFTVAVTDAARREVRAQRTLRATVDGYAVNATPLNKLPKPGEAVRVEFRAQDANQQPVAVSGEVKVSRDYWWEVWLDSFGREVSGDELKKKRAESPVWPPQVGPGMKEWTRQSQGYRSEVISTQRVATGTNGLGELRFTPTREGYYRVMWDSPDVWAITGGTAVTNRIRAECAVWATTTGPSEVGYRADGIQLVVDRDTFRAGEKAPVMVVASNPGQWIWLTVDSDGLAAQQVFQMPGTTRLIEIDVTDQMVPNFFLRVAAVTEQRLFTDMKSLVVPPVRNFLDVEVKPESAESRPGTEGRLTVTTKDSEGRPVPAEVAVAIVDESVFYIQSALAPDPREFFFGDRRPETINVRSSLDERSYRRLARGRDGALRDQLGRGVRDLAAGVVVTDFLGQQTLAESLADAPAPRMLMFGAVPDVELAKLTAGAADSEPVVVVRRDFRATAYWHPDVQTDGEGRASVKFRYPDSTTRWQARAVAGSAGNQFGLGTNSTQTRSPLVVRLQTPRFLTTSDQAVISALLNNNTEVPMTVATTLAAEGVTIAGVWKDGKAIKGEPEPVSVVAGGEARVEWLVSAQVAGAAKFTVTAKAATEADAMGREVPVFEYGLEKLLARSGKATTDVTLALTLPRRLPATTDFTVSVTPSLAVTMLDALPYLADYPYGCTEQTLSRFLPAVIVRKTLRDVGLDAETIMARTFGGVTTNSAGKVSPALGGKKDLLKLDEMVAAGLQRLYGFQHGNGAWGWWAEGPDDAWMTAYVVWGLRVAQTAGVVIEDERLARADQWLAQQLIGFQNEPDRAAWALHALAGGRKSAGSPAPNEFERAAFDRAFARRSELNAYSQALLALAAERLGFAEQAKTLVEILVTSAVTDDVPDTSVLYGAGVKGASTQATAHWGRTDRSWRWSDNGVEATAFAVRALSELAPKNPRLDQAVTWLLKNRRGASWSNTRATAISILALTDYLRASGELKSDLSFEVRVNGRKVAERSLTPADVLAAPARFAVPESAIAEGTNVVEIVRRGGSAPMYFSVEARFFTQERPITPAATDLFVRRDYFRLVPVPTLLEGVVDQRVPLLDGESITSGDRLEARLILEIKNDLEYLLLEDLKPAGIEAIEVQSGYQLTAMELKPEGARKVSARPDSPVIPEDRTGREEGLYVEWRDRRAAMFADRLPAGVWEIRVPYRAETPGQYAALPTAGEAMYAPEIKGNSASEEMRIRDSDK